MTLRNVVFTAIASVWVVAMVACAGDRASGQRGELVADVQATPHPGWVEVTWRHGGAESYEIYREALQAAQIEGQAFQRIGQVDGDARSFADTRVVAGATYRYAVAAGGSEPVPAEGGAVAPEPGHALRVEFATSIPAGAEFEAVSDPAGIQCASAGAAGCTAAFPSIADVTLSARAAGASWSWSGCDAVSDAVCSVSMSTERSVTVSLTPANTLAVVVEPRGAGVVANVNDLGSNPAVECTTECTYPYPAELAIGLAAEPADAEHYRFVSWGGACTGGSCTVTMDGDRRVEAKFALVAPEIDSFTASPDAIEPGESATLGWDVSGGGDVASGELSIEIEPDVGELSARSGSVEVTPTSDTTYTLSVTNSAGTAQQSRTVSVDDGGSPPTIEYFTAEEDEIDEGDRTWLYWSVSGSGDVSVTIEPGIGSVPEAGRRWVEPREDTTYRLTASNRHGSATEDVEVEVEDDDDDSAGTDSNR